MKIECEPLQCCSVTIVVCWRVGHCGVFEALRMQCVGRGDTISVTVSAARQDDVIVAPRLEACPYVLRA